MADIAIARTALTTASSKAAATTLVSSAVTVNPGQTLLIGIASSPVALAASHACVWNGSDCTLCVSALGASMLVAIYYIQAFTGFSGSQAITVTWSASATVRALVAIAVTGLDTLNNGAIPNSLDTVTSFAGSSTGVANNDGTSTPKFAREIYFGLIGVLDTSLSTAPTWGNGWTAGQRGGTSGGTANTNIYIQEGFLITPSVAVAQGAVAGITAGATSFITHATFNTPKRRRQTGVF